MTQKNIFAGAALAALAMLSGLNCAVAGGASGTSAFQFLQLGVGARPAAMGEVFAGVADDVNAIYWNPAGLADMRRREASLTHALWLEGITYSNFACGLPMKGGTVAVAFNVLNSGGIEKADNTGLRLGEDYNMSEAAGIVGYARRLGRLALGANLKFIASRIEEEYAHSYALDAGALYSGLRAWGKPLRLGLSVQNVGTKAKYVSEKTSLPVIVRAGWALELFNGLLLASDLNYKEEELTLHAGAEYSRAFGTVVLAARAGYKNDTVRQLGALSGITTGMGIKWKDYQLDYAWNSFIDLGITHRLSMGIKFGAASDNTERPAAAPAMTGVSFSGTDSDGAAAPADRAVKLPAEEQAPNNSLLDDQAF